jgi:nitrogen fixation NifU-like protein
MDLESAREILLRHSKSKTNGVFPIQANRSAKMTNPICGDHVEFQIYFENDILVEIGHKAKACAICSASASLLSELLKGSTSSEVFQKAEMFEVEILSADEKPWPEALRPLICFEHLRINPSRRMCALLPWVAIKSALQKGV